MAANSPTFSLHTGFALPNVFEKCQIIEGNTGGVLKSYVNIGGGAVTDYRAWGKIDNLYDASSIPGCVITSSTFTKCCAEQWMIQLIVKTPYIGYMKTSSLWPLIMRVHTYPYNKDKIKLGIYRSRGAKLLVAQMVQREREKMEGGTDREATREVCDTSLSLPTLKLPII